MSKVAKIILVGFAGLVGLAAIVLLGLNIYVQSAGVRVKIEERLSDALDVPIQIRRISVTPLGGLTFSGVTVPDPTEATPLLASEAVFANLRVIPFLSGKVIIDEISLRSPVVTWRQHEGKWQLPPSPRSASKSEPHPPDAAPKIEKPSPGPEKAVVRVNVREWNIREGKFSFLKEDGTGFAALDAVNVQSDVADDESMTGEAKTASLLFADRYHMTDLSAPFTFQKGRLDLPAITARMAKGTVHGQFGMEPEKSGTPFTMKLDFEDVDLAELLANAGVTTMKAGGFMNGFLELEGKARKRKDLNGRGSISLQNGTLDQYPILQMIGRVLQVDELDQMKLSAAEVRYTIHSGNIDIDSLQLKSQNIQVDAKGTIERDNDVKLDARMTLSANILRQLPPMIENNFQPIEGSDRRSIDFEVRGTVSDPKTNLVEAAIGRQLKREAQDFLKNIWGGH